MELIRKLRNFLGIESTKNKIVQIAANLTDVDQLHKIIKTEKPAEISFEWKQYDEYGTVTELKFAPKDGNARIGRVYTSLIFPGGKPASSGYTEINEGGTPHFDGHGKYVRIDKDK